MDRFRFQVIQLCPGGHVWVVMLSYNIGEGVQSDNRSTPQTLERLDSSKNRISDLPYLPRDVNIRKRQVSSVLDLPSSTIPSNDPSKLTRYKFVSP